jgi:hypothetical protein
MWLAERSIFPVQVDVLFDIWLAQLLIFPKSRSGHPKLLKQPTTADDLRGPGIASALQIPHRRSQQIGGGLSNSWLVLTKVVRK